MEWQIQQYLETLFAKAAGVGTLALLRMLKLTHSQCSLLIEDLKQYDFSGSGGETTGTATYISTDRRTGATTSVTLGAMLDGQMEEIFSQYLEGGRYLELETKWLVIAYKDLTEKFHKYHVSADNRKKWGRHQLSTSCVNTGSSI